METNWSLEKKKKKRRKEDIDSELRTTDAVMVGSFAMWCSG